MSTSTEESKTEHGEHAGPGVEGEHHGHHVLPISIYLRVYGGLVLLTYLTVQISYLPLGSASLPTAICIAIVKAGLVIGFFMHLRYDVRFNSLVFFASLLFVAIFFSLTMIDLLSRGHVSPETSTPVYSRQQDALAAAAAAQQTSQADQAAAAAHTTEQQPSPAPGDQPPQPERVNHKLRPWKVDHDAMPANRGDGVGLETGLSP